VAPGGASNSLAPALLLYIATAGDADRIVGYIRDMNLVLDIFSLFFFIFCVFFMFMLPLW